MTRIVLAEDHQIVRQGLVALLAANADLEVVGEAEDGLQAVQLVERLHPDALVLDLMMPGLNGVQVTRQTKQRSPETAVIILSMHANEAYVLDALAAGAMAYVLKRSTAADLVHAIYEALAGRRYLSPPLSERLVEAYIQKAKAEQFDPYMTLTPREAEILQLAAEGHTNVEMGKRLSISPRTVEMHRANFMSKLGLRTQADLVQYALQRGILHPD